MTARIEKFSVLDNAPGGGFEIQIQARIIKSNERIPQVITERSSSIEELQQRHHFNWPPNGRNTPEGRLIKVKKEGELYCLEE
jgi:hypothetical protein